MYKMYPYRLYITGSNRFNNYFLFMHYLDQYRSDKSFLFSTKSSLIDTMSTLYATAHGLCHMSCNMDKGLEKYKNSSTLNFKIADTTDMLIAFSDGTDAEISELANAYTLCRKQVSIVDITPADSIIPGLVVSDSLRPGETATFEELYEKYLDPFYKASTYSEAAMKFLTDVYRNKDLMKLVIDSRDINLVVKDKLGLAIKALLYWIYDNQFDVLQSDYENMVEPQDMDRKKRFTLREYKHAEPCEWLPGGESVEVYTGTGLPLSHGYTDVVTKFEKTFLEISDDQIIKDHIHKSMNSRMFTENEDEHVYITYRTSDTESYPITYQVAHFDDNPFRMNFWYISTDYVTKLK